MGSRHKRSEASTSSYQPLVPGEDDGVQHGLVEEAVAHPLRDDDVHLFHRELHLLHLALEDGYDCKVHGRQRINTQACSSNQCRTIALFSDLGFL